MRLSELIRYYSSLPIQQELVRFAKDREVATQFGQAFGKRPDVLELPSDVIKQVRSGATSFHCSEERWSNPLNLTSNSEKKDLDALRIGFDLVLDIDCKIFEWAKVCAKLLMWALETHSVEHFSIKFSGGTGFHIGIPWEAFAADERWAFPDVAQIVAKYLREYIRQPLARDIAELEGDVKKISEKSGKKPSEFMQNGALNPYKLLEIDTILISPRHLFRMPYSLNEKKGLVSLPMKPRDVNKFQPEMARPENIKTVSMKFLDPEHVRSGEASQLLMQALDWNIRSTEKQQTREVIKVEYADKVPVEAFPPCIKCIMEGLPDGRKRSLFALINFLKSVKWPWLEIEQFVYECNQKNNPPLKTGYVKSQLSWHSRHKESVPPPNCRQFYQDIGICKADFTCNRVKNPISYPKHKISKKVIKQ
ncbi:MAG: hypothetical protein NTY99_03890 [DPANN group archaeon]|nr:hypothetical protein [DPANN group archaeon]